MERRTNGLVNRLKISDADPQKVEDVGGVLIGTFAIFAVVAIIAALIMGIVNPLAIIQAH